MNDKTKRKMSGPERVKEEKKQKLVDSFGSMKTISAYFLSQNKTPLPTSSVQDQSTPSTSTVHDIPPTSASAIHDQSPTTTSAVHDILPPSVSTVHDSLPLSKTTVHDIPLNSSSVTNSFENKMLQEFIKPYDIGLLYKKIRQFSASNRYDIIRNVAKPDVNHCFPQTQEGKKKRSFQYKWLVANQWLVYSQALNGGLCLPCIIFAKTSHRSTGVFVSTPLTKFKDGPQDIYKHTETEYHKNSMKDLASFIEIMEQRQANVIQQTCSSIQLRIQQNRRKLMSILQTVILCGRQNIPLQGHNETDTNSNNNRGNFQALLDFRICAGDNILEEHFKTAPKTATYRSKTIQNQLINGCGDNIRCTVVEQIKEAVYFSIMADEVTDASNKEQLALAVRFYDGVQICERFVDFIRCDSVTGESIAKLLIGKLQEYGLDLSKLRGQGFDGAGNMAGKIKGAAAIISQQYPNAVYFHCNSHVLNLAVVQACSLQPIRNMMGTLLEVCIFFKYSPKRHLQLQHNIQHLCPESRKQKLVDLCKTRWVARHDALEVFGELYTAVVQTLNDIADGDSWNQESVAKARGLLLGVTQFDFLISYVTCCNGLRFIHSLSVSLQGRSIDICSAMIEVSNVISSIERCRKEIDEVSLEWYTQATSLSKSVDAPEPSVPRLGKRQINRANTPSDSPEQYFRRTVIIPFIDHLLSELKTRFSPLQQRAVQGIALVPSIFLSNPQTKKKEAKAYGELIVMDLPSPHTLCTELECWQSKWESSSSDVPSSLVTTLQQTSATFYPNIHTMLRVSATIPVTSCECERSFSRLRQLKTYLRSTMGDERLSSLALMCINRDIDIDTEKVLDKFARDQTRRMELMDILSD